MKISIVIVVIIFFTSLYAQDQRKNIIYFNDWGFCGPGPVILEELVLFSDSSFEYSHCYLQNFRIDASGHFSRNGKIYVLEYDSIIIDTLADNQEKVDKINFRLIAEFEIIRDKIWLENKHGMLFECGKQFGSKNKMFEPRKRRVVVIKFQDYRP